MHKKSKAVYQIPFTSFRVYIVDTIIWLETRLKEYQDVCERGMTEKSAVGKRKQYSPEPKDTKSCL